jgi:UDP-N-acetylglucosamine 1-carboxyvinyltransferase
MDKIIIRGGKPLSGRIPISGAKNSALTLLPCALLTDEPLTLRNLPRLADVDSFGHLLNQLGVSTMIEGARPEDFGRVMTLRAGRVTSTVAPYDIVRKMRASILVLGPLLARAGEAKSRCPAAARSATARSTCTSRRSRRWAQRSRCRAGYVKAQAPKEGLKARDDRFPRGLGRRDRERADGRGRWRKAPPCWRMRRASPRSSIWCNLLVAMGAKIDGIGGSTLVIHGKDRLHGATYKRDADRIEAGSYACAAVAITGGALDLTGAKARRDEATRRCAGEAGVIVEENRRWHRVRSQWPAARR